MSPLTQQISQIFQIFALHLPVLLELLILHQSQNFLFQVQQPRSSQTRMQISYSQHQTCSMIQNQRQKSLMTRHLFIYLTISQLLQFYFLRPVQISWRSKPLYERYVMHSQQITLCCYLIILTVPSQPKGQGLFRAKVRFFSQSVKQTCVLFHFIITLLLFSYHPLAFVSLQVLQKRRQIQTRRYL